MTKATCPFKPGDRVWAYGRDSGGDEQQNSVASQRRAIEEFCQRNNLVLAHFFADEARVGSTTAGREGLEDLLYLARQAPRPVEGVVFWSFSRLARDQNDSQFIKADLRRHGYIVHSISDDIPVGDFTPVVEALVDYQNQQFLKTPSRDVKRGLHDLVKKGYAPGGFPPRGYKAERIQIGVKRDGQPHVVSRWVPDPELAPRVRQAFTMRAAGASHKEIHEQTRVMGTLGSYVTMFRNRTYLGILKCGELEIEDVHESIVDRETWDAVQATLRAQIEQGTRWPEGNTHPRRATTPYLLSGLARCSVCGAAMVSGRDNISGNRKSPWRFYLCGRKKREGWSSCSSGKIGASGPEQAVLQIVSERVLIPDFIEALVAEVNRQLTQDTPDSLSATIREKQKRLDEVNKSINVLLDLAEQFGAASAGPRLLEREAEQKRLLSELRQLELQADTPRTETSPEMVERVLSDMHGVVVGDDVRAQRALLSKVVTSIEMGPTGGDVSYTFPLREVTGIYPVPPREFESLSPP